MAQPDMAQAPGGEAPGGRRRRWLVPVIVAAAVVISAAIGVTLYYTLRPAEGGLVETQTTVAPRVVWGTPETYTDMANDDPALAAARAMGGYGLLEPDADGRFRPDDPVTRAEFASLVVAVFNLECPQPLSPTFSDVMPGDSRYLVVEAAAPFFRQVEGSGQNVDVFGPDEPIGSNVARGVIELLVEKTALGSTGRLTAPPSTGSSSADAQALTRAAAAQLFLPVIGGLQPLPADTFEAVGIN